jgi:hypothetical protein
MCSIVYSVGFSCIDDEGEFSYMVRRKVNNEAIDNIDELLDRDFSLKQVFKCDDDSWVSETEDAELELIFCSRDNIDESLLAVLAWEEQCLLVHRDFERFLL